MKSPWPWFTLILTVVVIFNPYGLEIVSSAIRYSPTDWFRDLWVMITLAGAAILVILGLIEWRIRKTMTTRRVRRKHAQEVESTVISEAKANPRT
jgi:hypothetical protein